MRLKRSCRLFFPAALVTIFCTGVQQTWAAPAPTTTTLTISSGGGSIASGGSVGSGSVVTLTAAVVSGSTKVTTGQVNFCDAAVTYCTDIHLLGTAQLTKTGTATIKFRPGTGSHSYKAVFAGTPNGVLSCAASTSSIAALSVMGGSVTTTQIAQSGNPGDYTLTATVSGFGSTAPTGTVSFLDTSNDNAVLGTATLTAGRAGFNLVNAPNQATGGGPAAIATGDFNGDGILDLVMASGAVLLGNGDGTFREAANLPTSGPITGSIIVGDFNEDGTLDLAITNEDSNTVAVLLGNGDGTFTATAANLPTGDEPMGMVTGDFNGDGIPDLAVANYDSDTVTVLLGNGDGTFAASAPPATGSGPNSIAVADFNGDSIPDLAVANEGSSNITVLLGNGDGTFTATTSSPSVGGLSIATADLNGDGKPDLALLGEGGVTVFLGDGTGNFSVAGAATELIGYNPVSIKMGDFNGDGIPDLAVVSAEDMLGGYVEILLGNGNGGFTAASYDGEVIYDWIGRDADTVAVGDFNGDGISDLASPANNYDLTGVQVEVLLATNQTATATANGVAVPVATGTSQVVASYPGNSNYKASTSGAMPLTAAQGTPAVSLTVSPNPASPNTPVTLTATVTGSGLTPTGAVTFNDGIKQLGLGALNNSGVATFTTAAGTLSGGANSLTATYNGDANYSAGTGTTTVTVSQVGMAIPAPAAVAPGASATATATFTASSSYSGTLNLTCALTKSPTGAQSLPACSLNPTSVSLKTSGSGTSVLTLSTTAPSSASLADPSRKGLWGFGGGSAVLAVLFLCGIPAHRRRFASMLALLCLVFASLAIGCGGGGSTGNNLGPANPGTTSGSYIFTVTGTDSVSAAITTSTTVTLTVQ
ncbi:MAG TPA: FG-GAP-like repeat-containing protein [Terracidiphilus sp.]|jgi:hypothetical protein